MVPGCRRNAAGALRMGRYKKTGEGSPVVDPARKF